MCSKVEFSQMNMIFFVVYTMHVCVCLYSSIIQFIRHFTDLVVVVVVSSLSLTTNSCHVLYAIHYYCMKPKRYNRRSAEIFRWIWLRLLENIRLLLLFNAHVCVCANVCTLMFIGFKSGTHACTLFSLFYVVVISVWSVIKQ